MVDAAEVAPIPEASDQGYQGEWRHWDQEARGHTLVRRLAKGFKPWIEVMSEPPAQLGSLVSFDHFSSQGRPSHTPAPAAGGDRWRLGDYRSRRG